MTLAEEWMPYKLGDSILRLPNIDETNLTLEQLASKGSVWRTRKSSYYVHGKLKDYRLGETLENIVTHVQEKTDVIIYFLKTYGLESWTIRITNKGAK